MSVRGRGNIFNNPRTLDQMLKLRNKGVGPSELARMFGVDHTTIIYHSKKANITAPIQKGVTISGGQTVIETTKTSIIVSGVSVSVRVDPDDGSPINLGKNYVEYLEEIENRKWNRLLKKDIKK